MHSMITRIVNRSYNTFRVYQWSVTDSSKLPVYCISRHFAYNDPKPIIGFPKSLVSVNSIAAGLDHVIAILKLSKEKKLMSWGSNIYGQSGQFSSNMSLALSFSDTDFNLVPNNIVNISDGSNVKKIVCGYFHNLVLMDSTAELWSWGAGFLGFGDEAYHTYPRLLSDHINCPFKRSLGYQILDCYASGYYSIVKVLVDGLVEYYFWGTLDIPQEESSHMVPRKDISLWKTMKDLFFPPTEDIIDIIPYKSNITKTRTLSPIPLSFLKGKDYEFIQCYPNAVVLLHNDSQNTSHITLDILYGRTGPDCMYRPSNPYAFHNSDYYPITLRQIHKELDDNQTIDPLLHSSCKLDILGKSINKIYLTSNYHLCILTKDSHLLHYSLTEAMNGQDTKIISPHISHDMSSLSIKELVLISLDHLQLHVYFVSLDGKVYHTIIDCDKESSLLMNKIHKLDIPFNVNNICCSMDMIYAW